MTGPEWVANVCRYKNLCGIDFVIEKAVELADDIIAIRDVAGECTLYFDKACYRSGIDVSLYLVGFPKGIGIIEFVMARDWDTIRAVAKANIMPINRTPSINWHEEPIEVEYGFV